MRQFYTITTYQAARVAYDLLPFRFHRLSAERELLVNEAGEYLIAPTGTAADLVHHRLVPRTVLYQDLKARHFLTDNDSSPLLSVLATKYRTKKHFLQGGPKLHMLVVTLRCDHSCHYCQVSRQTTDRTTYDMTIETADAALQVMLQSPSKYLTLEFQGGEPLLAFPMIRWIVARAKELAAIRGKVLDFVICTTLAPATNDILHYCRQEGIKLSVSLDGPAFLHNANRPRPGNDSYERTIAGIAHARAVVGPENVAAIMTTTRRSLDYPVEIVDEYVRQDFRSIFLRPLSPYGFAIKTARKTGYDMDRFLAFYKAGLAHIIALNRQGVDIQEVYAKIILAKILTPSATGYVDLQSPTGAGLGALVYNYNGKVYASDESRMLAEMNDETFCLGTVTDTYQQLLTGTQMQAILAAGINESLPGCDTCALQSYCGADPILHHATQNDMVGHRPTSTFCHKNMSIISHLFSMLDEGDREFLRIAFAWVRDRGVADVRAEATACV